MDISEVTKSAGVPASTLRFYEEKGLINSVGRQGKRRQYSANVLERLALIALELHLTPAGNKQKFVYCFCKRLA